MHSFIRGSSEKHKNSIINNVKGLCFMKKYVSPEITLVKAETVDIMVGSDVIVDIGDLFN